MAELVVNIVLTIAVLVLVAIWAVSGVRRRQDRRQHAEERKLILQAFVGAAAAPPPATAPKPVSPAAPVAEPGAQHLDAASVAALLDLLEDRRPARRGMFVGLVNSPRSVWSAAARAGQNVSRRTTGKVPDGDAVGPELYREAAAELVDIYAHDPRDARREYLRYADAVGDPALAELYVRSAAYSTYAEHDQVRQVIEQITGTVHPREVSDGAATIDT